MVQRNFSQFVVAACTAGKGIGKVASFVGKIFMHGSMQCSTTNSFRIIILPHENYTAVWYNYNKLHYHNQLNFTLL